MAASGASSVAPSAPYQSNVNLQPLQTPGELTLGGGYATGGTFDPNYGGYFNPYGG